MARCEDYPCCGHTSDDPCPDRDSKGNIVMRCCDCNKRLSKNARSSLCASCQRNSFRSFEDYDNRRSDDR